MNKTFSLAQLAEGINRQVVANGNQKMVQKWAQTGLLEGLSPLASDRMARLLENQTAEILRNPTILQEAAVLSTGGGGLVSSGQVAGFTNVAFPIVRRVFAGLISNELVSVQPMSLPSGLLFYMDYAYGSNVGGDAGVTLSSASTNETYTKGQSVYNNPVGSGVRSGSLATGGMYNNVGSGYSRVHLQALNLIAATDSVGAWLSGSTWTTSGTGRSVTNLNDFVGLNARWADYDPKVEVDLDNNVFDFCFLFISASEITSKINGADLTSLDQFAITGLGASPGGATNWGVNYQQGTGVMNLRRLTKRGDWNPTLGTFTRNELNGSHVLNVIALSNTGATPTVGNATGNAVTASIVISDALSVNSDGSTLTIPSFESDFGATPSPAIPEVEIKIESVAVTATTRKLRARWSPEMAQDLTAFYSIDVEAELTNIISEMVTLDIDREILNDLLSQANAANYYWSRSPGRFVNKYTGSEGLRSSTLAPGPQFTGTVREWYETLMETVTDAANVIHKKTLRGSGNFVVCGPEVSTILEHTQAWKANFKIGSDGQVSDQMSIGAESTGTLNGRYTVYRDPYFPVNKILIGLKGSGFLESGYIYAPYVPLLLTPVIYGPEDFTPRKGLMTRYGKKMVRSDFYATITILDMGII